MKVLCVVSYASGHSLHVRVTLNSRWLILLFLLGFKPLCLFRRIVSGILCPLSRHPMPVSFLLSFRRMLSGFLPSFVSPASYAGFLSSFIPPDIIRHCFFVYCPGILCRFPFFFHSVGLYPAFFLRLLARHFMSVFLSSFSGRYYRPLPFHFSPFQSLVFLKSAAKVLLI